MIELRHLRAFTAVARHQHFTRAAVALGVAQPALSQQIAQLEDELAVRLFERSRRGALLTAAGRSLLVRSERVLAELESARAEARDLVGLVRGRVVLGTLSSLAALRLPVLLGRFRERHPGLDIVLREDHAAQLLALLAGGGLDLALVHHGSVGTRRTSLGRRATPAGIATESVADEELVLALPRGHRLAGASRVAFADLAGEAFVLYKEGSTLRDVVLAAAARAGFVPRSALEASGNDTVRAFVAAGFGVALVPRSVAVAPGPAIASVTMTPRISRIVSLAWRRHGVMSPPVQALFDFLRRHAPEWAQR